jgi:FkbM family methyltransferase
MAEHTSSPLRAILRQVPGLVTVVRHLRALWRRGQIAAIGSAVRWAKHTVARRRLVFAALPDRLALAQHAQETYVVNTADKVISRSLYAGGQFDFQKFETAAALIRAHGGPGPDAVLIDAGANIGSICIPAVRRGLVARAIAFELDPGNTRLLRINALLNGAEDRIDIRNMAVGAAPGAVTVQHSTTNFGDHRVGAAAQGDDGTSVPMVALNSVAGDLDLSRCILWMDVQGYEAFALQGARRFMAAGVPLITEFSREDLDSTGCFDLFLSLVTHAGYSVFFDLDATPPEATPLCRATLEEISDRLTEQGTFTDLLFLPAPPA